jgi:hypothetical protein
MIINKTFRTIIDGIVKEHNGYAAANQHMANSKSNEAVIIIEVKKVSEK